MPEKMSHRGKKQYTAIFIGSMTQEGLFLLNDWCEKSDMLFLSL